LLQKDGLHPNRWGDVTKYYVSNSAANNIPAGSADGSGSKASPFLTLEQALRVARDGDTIYLNNGAYSPASGDYVITAGVDIESVSPGQATIKASSSAAPIDIATTGGQTVTFGAVNIDAGSAAQNAILLNSEAKTYSLVLSGTHLFNATAYAIGGDGGQTRANVSTNDVTYSAAASLGMIGLGTLAAGAIDIRGGQVEISDQTSGNASQKSGVLDESGSVALIDATSADVSVDISGVTAAATLDKADTSVGAYAPVVGSIALYNVAGAVIQDNNLTLAGAAAGADIWVQTDPENPLQASGAVIDHNSVKNFAAGGGMIVVGENFASGTDLSGYADNARIYDNIGLGDAASQAKGLHGILVGFETGAVVSGNVITSAFVAYGMKDDFGSSLVEDNVDYDSSRYSLYQKGGSGVEWLSNSGYESAGFEPFGLAVGADNDEPGGVIYASGGEADGNLIVYSGTAGAATYIEAGDTFAAVGAGISGVDDAGTLLASSGGRVTSAVIYVGGVEAVLSGGSAAGVLIGSGGTLSVSFGGSATGVRVEAGGSILGPVTLTAAAVDQAIFSGVIVDAALTVASGGAAIGTQVLVGGREVVASGGVAIGATVRAGGSLTVEAGGVLTLSGGAVSGGVVSSAHVIGAPTTVSGAALSSGAILDLLDQTVSSGGRIVVDSAAVASGARVLSGGELIVSRGGVASGSLLSGGRTAVSAGGAGVDVTVAGGGVLYVLASAATTGTQVSGGGYELVSYGGVSRDARVLSGGHDEVYAGGQAIGATVSSGGLETINAGGTAIGLALLTGGVAVDDGEIRIEGAGTLDGTLSGTGAIAQVAAGDLVISGAGTAFAGRAVIEAGTIELATSGALGTGYVQFVEPATGSAVLQIDAADAPAAGGTFANTLSNFSGAHEDIDLRSIVYVAGASATVSGSTLVLSDGGKTYKFNLAGTTGAYTVTSDGHGGTLIDPRAAAFTQTAAAFAPEAAGKTALASSTAPSAHLPFGHAPPASGARY
jgi:autotransporter passenger strand-loop-strand repeat protein